MNTYLWKHQRRFNAFSNYHLEYFGERIQKLSVNAGFSCPNRDGSIALNGCTYCNNSAFNPSYCSPKKSIAQQIIEGKEFHAKRYRRAGKYLVYFQAFSNTYSSLKNLKSLYSEALSQDNILGLVIGTRPDCVDDEKLDYLQELSEKHYISVEYGIESCYNKTLKRINRGHTFEQSVKAINETAARKIHCGAHLIFGLPGESRAEMLEQASIISELPLFSVKFHQLQIIKDTTMEMDYLKNPNDFYLFALPEYIDFIIDFCERLNPEIRIERFTAEVPPPMLVKGGFGLLRNDQILQKIEQRLEERNSWQGKNFNY